MTLNKVDREAVPEMPNRLGIAGIEFIEYATSRPQALGQVLENMGFRPVARHRSREVTLYRQGTMNLVVNANPDDARVSGTVDGQPVISAVAFRVQDALKAYNRCMELGAWTVGSHAQAMELHIPAIHGPGSSRFYFVDRWQEFSIYDIDFKPIPTVDPNPPALAGMSYFGVVQYIGAARSADWQTYYEHMFDFSSIPDDERFGILPKGKLMKSPCGTFLWQLIEPDVWMDSDDSPECLQRIGFGVANVAEAVATLKARGVEFVESSQLHPEDRGALTRHALGSVAFELVHQSK
ncbi:4-hydroxyphenylpyruvate dioxygenase [Limnohabitans radicicola]|uniref:4-hydroxyphenylpyruvate dioxygenase n=1 Tax=Limnohabitans radicicola TaxID=2771427 RepID=A0A927FFQ5_9BURK|nr:4-hydroxyphenylpyruvate dioxygenase [Limnohabitans radicicola]MBD8050564.1 4-hydroxyphenylpyruvate dioxygenase [Limnohabitans radicicola]